MNIKLDNTLLKGAAILEDAGLPYFLVGGTLLGIVREGGLLAHDRDVDVAVLEEDITPKIKLKLKSYKQFAAESECISETGQLVFVFDEVHFDIFPMTKKGERRYFNQSGIHGLWWPAELVEKPWSEIEYRGIKWNAPSSPEEFLTHMYGDWRMEDKSFRWNVNSLNYMEDIR